MVIFFNIFKVCQDSFNPQAFTFCFSKDGDLFSQWRAYAADGTGVSIGFDSEIISKLTPLSPELYLKDVIYKKDKQISEIKKVIKQFFSNLSEQYSLERSSISFGSYIEENDD